MLTTRTLVRKTPLSAFVALLVACLLIPSAGARADSGTESTAKKATAKKSSPGQHSAKSAGRTKSTASRTSSRTSSKKRSLKKKSTRVRGQQKIDSERAQEIQQALIREHYLNGEATGTWNDASEEAMRRYQADHGWQSKTVPDSRALITLGLGPSKDHLLNPESAMTTVPDRPKAESLPTNSHSAPAASTPMPAVSSAPTTGSNASGTMSPQ